MRSSHRYLARRAEKSPGELIDTGAVDSQPRITIHDYDVDGVREHELESLETYSDLPRGRGVRWVRIEGAPSVTTLRAIGDVFDMHDLALEDIADPEQRSKVEAYTHYSLIVLKAARAADGPETVAIETVSVVLLEGVCISFEEAGSGVLSPVAERIRRGRGIVRQAGADYLCYSLVDAVIDSCYPVLESMAHELMRLERQLQESSVREDLLYVHVLRSCIMRIDFALRPMRDIVSQLRAEHGALMTPATDVYLRDLGDNVAHVVDEIEMLRTYLSAIIDSHVSVAGYRMSRVMQMLTIISTIFIPLTFIVGVYGMNFEHMPELGWRWGYPAVWGLILGAVGMMLVYFRRKRWL